MIPGPGEDFEEINVIDDRPAVIEPSVTITNVEPEIYEATGDFMPFDIQMAYYPPTAVS